MLCTFEAKLYWGNSQLFFLASYFKSLLCTSTTFSSLTLLFVGRNSQRMPTDVTEALLQIFMKEGKMERTKAEELLGTLEGERHFQSETWS